MSEASYRFCGQRVVRALVTPPPGLRPIWRYPHGNLDGFLRFMADRAAIERWKQTFALHFREVKGARHGEASAYTEALRSTGLCHPPEPPGRVAYHGAGHPARCSPA